MKNPFKNLSFQKSDIPFFKRLFAYFIDWYITSILTILPINLIFSLTYNQKNFASTLANLPLSQAILAFTIGLLLSVLYLVYYPYKHNGQTLGKKLLSLQIIKKDNTTLSFKTLLIRNGLGILLIEGTFYSCSIYFWEVINIASNTTISSIVLSLLGFVSVASMALSIFNANHCMLHDYLSKTRVIAIPK